MCGNVGVLLLNILRMICAAFDFSGKTRLLRVKIEEKFVDTCFKKIKTFQGNQKSHLNKTLRKAFMKRWQFKNKANKT